MPQLGTDLLWQRPSQNQASSRYHATTNRKRHMKKLATGLVALAAVTLLAGCATDADTVNHNLDVDAEGFKITRDIKFVNGITDSILLEVKGKCSVDTGDSDLGGSLQVTCKVQTDDGPKYVKHFLVLSDNVTATVEQILPAEADEYHYSFVVKPEGLIPNIEIDTKVGDGQ